VEETERWFLARGTPHFIEGYSATRDVFTRALPGLTLVFLFEMGGAVNADWTWWENVLAAAGGFVFLLGVWVAINRARGNQAFARPERVGRTELAVFLLAPAVVPLLFGGQIWQAIGLALANVVILATIYYVTSYALLPLTRWAIVTMVRQLSAVFGLLARALPMMLLVVALLLFTPEVWQVAANLHGPFLPVTVGLFVVMGGAFLITRLPTEIDRLAQVDSVSALTELCAGTPVAAHVSHVDPQALTPTPLSRRQRGNVALLVVVSQAIQVTLVAVVMGGFFVVFGLVAVRPEVVQSWVAQPDLDELFRFTVSGEGVVLTTELLRVAIFLAAFSGFYFTVYVITDATYRREFFEEVVAEVRQALAVRTVYLTVKAQREAGATAPGGALPPPAASVPADGPLQT